jgi:hypothetical protein
MKDFCAAVNDPLISGEERLKALKKLNASPGKRAGTTGSGEINNHIHTIYSFSPYTPSMAAFRAWEAGLAAAGSVDHDSIAAAGETLRACAELGIGGCVGFEVRVSFKNGPQGGEGPFAERKINNPDSKGLVYMTVQGIPKPALPAAGEFLKPIRAERLLRTQAMIEGANLILAEAGLRRIDFEEDIKAKSKAAEGGGITERHLLAAMAEKLTEKYGKGPALIEGLNAKFGVETPKKIRALLEDNKNPHYLFDLLGILKSAFLPRIFIQPTGKECIPAEEVTAFAASVGAIPAYAYLGDVGESPTGDKKAEKFEDDYLEELFDELARRSYQAVTYMPPRNTVEQLNRVRRLCAERGFMEISGVDINSSRQSFNCPEVLRPEFRHLLDTTWALIAHERLASVDGKLSLFAPQNPLAGRPLAERIAVYAAAGRDLDPRRPEESAFAVSSKIYQGRY